MKKTISAAVMAILVGMLVGACGRKASASTETVDLPTVKCSICKKTLENALREVDGIQYAEVDIDQMNASVTFDPSKTELAKIELAITKAGYQANEKERDPAAYEILPGCCK